VGLSSTGIGPANDELELAVAAVMSHRLIPGRRAITIDHAKSGRAVKLAEIFADYIHGNCGAMKIGGQHAPQASGRSALADD
jgi:hypothetical protein